MCAQLQPVRGSVSWPGLRLGLALLCLLGLAGCGGTDRQAAAQQRWQARRVQHYVLSIREFIGSHDCTQVVEIRDEQLVEILGLSCPLASIWTVDWLFRSVAQKQLADDRCALTVPGAGCVCRFVPDVRAEYDPLLGYPRSIVVHQNWAPAWQRPGYWAYLARNWAPPNCTAPSSRPSWELFVRELRPLP